MESNQANQFESNCVFEDLLPLPSVRLAATFFLVASNAMLHFYQTIVFPIEQIEKNTKKKKEQTKLSRVLLVQQKKQSSPYPILVVVPVKYTHTHMMALLHYRCVFVAG